MHPIIPQPGQTAPIPGPAAPIPVIMAPVSAVLALWRQDRIGRLTALAPEDMAAGLLWLAMNFPADRQPLAGGQVAAPRSPRRSWN